MAIRCFADDLKGTDWNAVRELRMKRVGEAGIVLSDDRIPEKFRHLLPYASLLNGEEGLLLDFWDAMSKSAQDELVKIMDPWLDEVRDFALLTSDAAFVSDLERQALLDLVRIYELADN
jgi:hypothetical protein